MQDNQQPIDSKEGKIDNTVGTFIFDHEKETETYVPNENFGKPVVSELDQAKARIAQLEQRLKEADSRSVCRWVDAKERVPEKRMNCHVMVWTPLHNGYAYKTIRLWTGQKWIDELFGSNDEVIEWLEEIPADQYNDQISALQNQLSEAHRNLTSMISEALEKSKQLDEALRLGRGKSKEAYDYWTVLEWIRARITLVANSDKYLNEMSDKIYDVFSHYPQPRKPTQP